MIVQHMSPGESAGQIQRERFPTVRAFGFIIWVRVAVIVKPNSKFLAARFAGNRLVEALFHFLSIPQVNTGLGIVREFELDYTSKGTEFIPLRWTQSRKASGLHVVLLSCLSWNWIGVLPLR